MSETKHERAIAAAEKAGQDVWKRRGSSSADAWAEGIAAYLAVMRQPGPDEVRVRAAVAVNRDEDGRPMWVIYGRNGESDETLSDDVAGDSFGCEEADQIRWIEANVPAYAPPTEPVVEGEVTP